MKLVLLISLICCVKLSYCQYCPYFSYVSEENNIFGRIQLENDFSGNYQLDVNMTVTARLPPDAKLKIIVISTAADIASGRDLVYKLSLPIKDLKPKLTGIVFNQKSYCAENAYQNSFGFVTLLTSRSTVQLSQPVQQPHRRPSNANPSIPNNQPHDSPEGIRYPLSNPIDSIYKNKFNNAGQPPLSRSTEAQTPMVIITTPALPPKVNVPSTAQPAVSIENVCGRVDSNSVQLIVHGEDALKSDYPWLGALFKQSSSGGSFICGATLLTKKHALTAAHCVNGVRPGRLHLVLGRGDLTQWLSAGEQVQIIDTQVHENYVPRQGEADIAILKFNRDIRFTSVIRPICLWNTDDNLQAVVGSTGVVVGWGVDDKGQSGTTPKKANLPIVSQEECLRSHSAFALLTSSRTFCAGYRNDSGPCSGDSGSGFYMKVNDRWYIRGIVSLSLLANNTCDLENFVVFADAAKFKDWILEYING